MALSGFQIYTLFNNNKLQTYKTLYTGCKSAAGGGGTKERIKAYLMQMQ